MKNPLVSQLNRLLLSSETKKGHCMLPYVLMCLLFTMGMHTAAQAQEAPQAPTMRSYYSVAIGAAGTRQGGFVGDANSPRGALATDFAMTHTLSPGFRRFSWTIASSVPFAHHVFGNQTLARSLETGEMGFETLDADETGGLQVFSVSLAPGIQMFLHKKDKRHGLYAQAEVPILYNLDAHTTFSNPDFYATRNQQFESYSNLQIMARGSLGFNFKETPQGHQYRVFVSYNHALTRLVENVTMGQSTIMLGVGISLKEFSD